jgi:GNAT superfamily N-acetyltransferase
VPETYITLVEPTDAAGIAMVRTLLEEYLAWLGPLVCGSTLPAEIASLPLPYGRPTGALLLARDDSGVAVGCVGIREYDAEVCEIKRLYVHKDVRRQGIARSLVRAAIDQARAMGYAEMLLTTLPDEMPGVVTLYRSLGFEDAEEFRHHGGKPADGVYLTYMGRCL